MRSLRRPVPRAALSLSRLDKTTLGSPVTGCLSGRREKRRVHTPVRAASAFENRLRPTWPISVAGPVVTPPIRAVAPLELRAFSGAKPRRSGVSPPPRLRAGDASSTNGGHLVSPWQRPATQMPPNPASPEGAQKRAKTEPWAHSLHLGDSRCRSAMIECRWLVADAMAGFLCCRERDLLLVLLET